MKHIRLFFFFLGSIGFFFVQTGCAVYRGANADTGKVAAEIMIEMAKDYEEWQKKMNAVPSEGSCAKYREKANELAHPPNPLLRRESDSEEVSRYLQFKNNRDKYEKCMKNR